MKLTRRAIRWMVPAAALLAGAIFTVYGQTDLTGFWAFRAPRGDGTFAESFLDLKQEGDQVTG